MREDSMHANRAFTSRATHRHPSTVGRRDWIVRAARFPAADACITFAKGQTRETLGKLPQGSSSLQFWLTPAGPSSCDPAGNTFSRRFHTPRYNVGRRANIGRNEAHAARDSLTAPVGGSWTIHGRYRFDRWGRGGDRNGPAPLQCRPAATSHSATDGWGAAFPSWSALSRWHRSSSCISCRPCLPS